MSYYEKLTEFFNRTGLTQVEIGDKIGYSQVMVGRYLKSNAPNFQFITAVSKGFPEIDWNYMFKGNVKPDNALNEEGGKYEKTPQILINEIDVRLKMLKKWHESDTIKK
jgi:transcriptional regulator with XRE-family HTH domain